MTQAVTQFDAVVEQARRIAEQNEQPQESGLVPTLVAAEQRFRVKSEQTDHLVCRTWDGTTEGTVDVSVAKPPTLRGDIATRMVMSEDQEIFPEYKANDEVWATVPNGGTGVSVTMVDVIWIDKNVDARKWSVECS